MFELPPLPYEYNALEPYIDARTVEIHHDKHQATYTNNLNAAVKGTDLEGKTIEYVMSVAKNYPPAVRNNAGGYWNHAFYWNVIGPNAGGQPKGELMRAIEKAFGSFDKFKEAFTQMALTQFGSGWAWLCAKKDGSVSVCQTLNQDNPIMNIDGKACGGIPILTVDVWEHAYYLKYQNLRADYVKNFFNLINWPMVEKLYADAVATGK